MAQPLLNLAMEQLQPLLTYAKAQPYHASAYALAALFVLEYWKVLPMMYHLRVIATMIQGAFLSRPFKGDDPAEAVITRHRVYLGDRDWNGHQNNSCYNLEIDVVRYLWVLRFLRRRPDWWAWYTGSSIRIANGGCSMYFLREIRVWQSYDVVTRLTHADKKWLYLQSDFVHPRTRVVYATGVTRIVFKKGPITMAPGEVLEALGYGAEKWRTPAGPDGKHAPGLFYLEDGGAGSSPRGGADGGPSTPLPEGLVSPWPGKAMEGLLGSLQDRVAGSLPVPAHRKKE